MCVQGTGCGTPFDCPECGQQLSFRIGYLKTSPDVLCPSCDVIIRIDANHLRRTVDEANKAVDDFRKNIRKLCK